MRPLCAFRNLVRLGLSMGPGPSQIGGSRSGPGPAAPLATAAELLGAPLRRQRVVRQDLALEHPDLDAAGAVGGLGRAGPVIDVGAQRVQRHAAFAIPLHARDLGAAETAGAVDPDALGAQPHRRLHGALHGAAERDAALQLLRDALGDQLRLDLGLADLDDVEADLAAGKLRDFRAQLLDVRALLADDDAGPRGVDGHSRLLGRAFDHHLGDAGLAEPAHQVVAELEILMQQVAVVLAREPAAVPGPVDAEPEADRIDLLTH